MMASDRFGCRLQHLLLAPPDPLERYSADIGQSGSKDRAYNRSNWTADEPNRCTDCRSTAVDYQLRRSRSVLIVSFHPFILALWPSPSQHAPASTAAALRTRRAQEVSQLDDNRRVADHARSAPWQWVSLTSDDPRLRPPRFEAVIGSLVK